jgi:hypothetical protein
LLVTFSLLLWLFSLLMVFWRPSCGGEIDGYLVLQTSLLLISILIALEPKVFTRCCQNQVYNVDRVCPTILFEIYFISYLPYLAVFLTIEIKCSKARVNAARVFRWVFNMLYFFGWVGFLVGLWSKVQSDINGYLRRLRRQVAARKRDASVYNSLARRRKVSAEGVLGQLLRGPRGIPTRYLLTKVRKLACHQHLDAGSGVLNDPAVCRWCAVQFRHLDHLFPTPCCQQVLHFDCLRSAVASRGLVCPSCNKDLSPFFYEKLKSDLLPELERLKRQRGS